MSKVLNVLTVGNSSSLVFVAWRLQASKSCRIYSVHGLHKRPAALVIDSDQYGTESGYFPDHIYEDLNEINLPLKFDTVIVAFENLRQVGKIAKSLTGLVSSDTAVLFDVSYGLPPISKLIRSKFADLCSLGLLMSDENVIQTADNRFLHTKSDAQVFVLPSLLPDSNLVNSNLRDLTIALQSAGCNATYSIPTAQFQRQQWQRAIATIALQPLSIILDTPDLNQLSTNIVAKPIYEGLMNELYAIAKWDISEKTAADIFPLPTSMTSFDGWVPSVPGSQSSSYLYYVFYKQFDIPVDVYLLQPILLGDEAGIRTPYLECIFAQFSHLLRTSSSPNALFERRRSSSGPGSGYLAGLKSREQDLAAKENELARREQELAKREQFLSRREQQIRSAPPPGHHMYTQGPARPVMTRPVSALPSIQSTPPPPGTPSIPSEEINMMSFTQRRSRRSFVRSQSTASLSQNYGYHGNQQQVYASTNGSMANGRRNSQGFSQSLDLDDMLTMSHDRYVGVSTKANDHAKLSSSRAPSAMSRSNSIVSVAPPLVPSSYSHSNGNYPVFNGSYANGNYPSASANGNYPSTNGHYASGASYGPKSTTAPRIPSPQISQSNLLDPALNRSSSSSSPSTPPSSATYIPYK